MMRFVTLILSLVLVACSSDGAAIQRYQLSPLNTPTPRSSAGGEQRLLRLQPVSLSKLIDAHGLIYQRSDIVVIEASGHQWAEDLGDQLTRSLRLQLSAQMPELLVLDAHDARSTDRADFTLQIRLDQFQGRHDGVAIVGGHWLLRDSQGRLLKTGDLLHQQVLGESGYPALVRSLSEAWSTVTSNLSVEVRSAVTRASVSSAAD